MGAHLYYYPFEGSALRDLDLGRPWTSLEVTPADNAVVETGLDRSQSILRWATWSRVRATCELSPYTAAAGLLAELQLLSRHLLAGGIVALAEEDDCNFGGYLVRGAAPGTTTFRVDRNLWRLWQPGNSDLGAGDQVAIRGPAHRGLEEELTVASRTGYTVETTTGCLLDYRVDDWAFLRDARFWPYLRLEASARQQQILSAGGQRILYELDLQLEEAVDLYAAGAPRLWPSAAGGNTYNNHPAAADLDPWYVNPRPRQLS